MWKNQIADPPKFWLAQGLSMATFDAMLDCSKATLDAKELVAVMADWIRTVRKGSGPGETSLSKTRSPRTRFAILAMYRWETRAQRLKDICASARHRCPRAKGLADGVADGSNCARQMEPVKAGRAA